MSLPGFGRPPAYYFMWILPRNFFSRLCGFVADIRLPRLFLTPLIRLFSWIFKVDLEEAELPASEFRTFNEFFTRKLVVGARLPDPDRETILCPVDGTIGEFGTISNGQLIQAKGLEYNLADLLKDPERTKSYEGGIFLTIYLAPHNYHRIHSMASGEVREFSYIPGDLWTVSPLGVHHVPNLFARNERLTTYVQTERGEFALVKVGATIVGRIRVCYHDQTSNRLGAVAKQIVLEHPHQLERGAELGLFELGSTVICLFPPGQIELFELQVEQQVCYGQAIGRYSQVSKER
ncbi:MAG: phosphatidylserine decarboxylase [SAR324 cluster bacterium]|nr:phosphatidylserine decarboxylase [SAR324 cluster bacterium]MBL7035417.1 phosphatidylserine decarboxylase [SAR324 cluster bacterium]